MSRNDWNGVGAVQRQMEKAETMNSGSEHLNGCARPRGESLANVGSDHGERTPSLIPASEALRENGFHAEVGDPTPLRTSSGVTFRYRVVSSQMGTDG